MNYIHRAMGQIHMEDTLYFYIYNKSETYAETFFHELRKLFRKKRLPIIMLKYDDKKILSKITYCIRYHDLQIDIRKAVRAGMTQAELCTNILEILTKKILSGLPAQKVEVIAINEEDAGKDFQFVKFVDEKRIIPNERMWAIPITPLRRMLKTYYQNKKKEFWDKTRIHHRSYFNLPCVRPLMSLGGVLGKRNSGAKVIAFACVAEGLTLEEAIAMGKHYHRIINSPDFTFREVLAWIKWAYSKRDLHWNCRIAQQIDECDKSICWFVKDYYAKSAP